MTRLVDMLSRVMKRMGDPTGAIWAADEVTVHLRKGYQYIAITQRIFWDVVYAENLPRGFSYTAPWEKTILDAAGGFDYGCANFTAEIDRRALGDERQRIGPANHTSPFEATDEWLATVNASTDIPATAELPKTLATLERVVHDHRPLDGEAPRSTSAVDGRYETTKGYVRGFMWEKDGVRTLRKVAVPAAQASTVAVDGSWGCIRDVTDLTDDTISGARDGGAFDMDAFEANAFDDDLVCWGAPARIPGHHPMGTESYGVARRTFLDELNTRIEHYRQGRALDSFGDVCELPARYCRYLQDFAQARLYERVGPGQDLALSAHFDERWARGLARIARRLIVVDSERVSVLGGDGPSSRSGPPRPRWPWAYGSQVR